MTISPALLPFAARQNEGPPARVGQRYSKTQFLPEAGNTVVCHLDSDAPGHEAVLEVRERLQALPGGEHFLPTPTSSLHMTVFEGVIETRRTPDAWPSGLDRGMPVEDVTRALLPRFELFVSPPAFQVRAVALLPVGLRLAGATSADQAAMRDWREALSQTFGYRHSDHDDYHFHMTFQYPTGWIKDEHLTAWGEGCANALADLQRAAPIIPLQPPAFCSFADMTHFEERLVLGGSPVKT